jgi:hypothetical protein
MTEEELRYANAYVRAKRGRENVYYNSRREGSGREGTAIRRAMKYSPIMSIAQAVSGGPSLDTAITDPGPMEHESRGKSHPDPAHYNPDAEAIREAFPDPAQADQGGWGGGYSITTRPATPKPPKDRPGAVADKLVRDAFKCSGGKPVLASVLHALADDAGISWETVRTALAEAGCVTFKPKGSHGKWFWSSPTPKQQQIAKGGGRLPQPQEDV